jgi:hypothetical protein
MIAKYLPSLAGAIILLTLGLLLVDLLVDYMQKKMVPPMSYSVL